MDHYATRILSIEALREPFRTLLTEAAACDENLRWMIDLPPKGMLRSKRRFTWLNKVWPVCQLTPHWLAALTDQRVLLIGIGEHSEKPETISIPLEAVLYLEYGMILLFSWITISWVEDGQVREQTLYYNAVSEGIVLPFIDLLRHAMVHDRSETDPVEPTLAASGKGFARWNNPQNRAFLDPMPLKFQNLIPHFGLRKGEQICQALYRPGQKGRLLEKGTPGMAILQTANSLLMTTENMASGESGYGMTFTFLPLNHIQSIQPDRNERSCCLHIRLKAQQTTRDLEVLFPTQMESKVHEFAQHFKEFWYHWK